MKKYIMKDINDYRPSFDNHEVKLIKRGMDGVEWAYGDFTQIDEDMVDCTEAEIAEVNSLNM